MSEKNNNLTPFSANTIESNLTNTNKIGKLLIQLGKISPQDTENILKLQKKEGLLFGDAAAKLGLIKNADIIKALSMQFDFQYLEKGKSGYDERLICAYEPFNPKVEAIKALRSQLKARWFEQGNAVLSIVSPSKEENSSILTANLAISFSQLGERTLLIDANLRTPAQKELFNISNNLGLSDLLAGRAGLETIVELSDIVGLSVLPAGTIPPNPQELIGRTLFAQLINLMSNQYDVVLIDCSPANETADAQAAIARAGGALVVSKLNYTSHHDLVELRNQIEITGAKLVAAIVTDM